jgi:hypothetical protein
MNTGSVNQPIPPEISMQRKQAATTNQPRKTGLRMGAPLRERVVYSL